MERLKAIMYAILCKPIVIHPPKSNPVLSGKDCRIVKLTPSQVSEDNLELEILEAPPIVIDPTEQSKDS